MHRTAMYRQAAERVASTPAAAMSRLKVRHLHLLRHLERHGSLTRAADEMGVSQPAVTKSLAEIESIFEAPLFRRSGRGLKATDLGELAMRKAGFLLQELDHWAAEMEAVRQGRQGRLLVGAVPYVPGTLLTRAIMDLLERHNVVIALSQATTDILVQALLDNELDCVLGRASAAAGHESLRHEVLYAQRPVIVGNSALITRLEGRKLDWAGLATLQWILPSLKTPVGAKMAEIFMQMEMPVPTPIIETYSLDVMHGVLSTNQKVVSVVPEDIAREMARRGGVAMLPWVMEWELPPISLIRRVRERPVAAEEQFAAILKELCRVQHVVHSASSSIQGCLP